MTTPRTTETQYPLMRKCFVAREICALEIALRITELATIRANPAANRMPNTVLASESLSVFLPDGFLVSLASPMSLYHLRDEQPASGSCFPQVPRLAGPYTRTEQRTPSQIQSP